MKSKKTFVSLLALSTTCAGLVGCGPKPSDSSTPASTSKERERVTLNMSVYYDNDDRHMKFIEGAAAQLPYTACDGTTYKAGDFKPVWKALQKKLNFTIDDLSPSGAISIKNQFTTLTSQAFKVSDKDVHIAQGNSDQIMSEGTTNKTILDLKEHLDKMPNFKAFLDNNPAVKKIISSDEGKIFYAPYFDGYDDIERMIMVRQDWVEKLLDGELPTGLDENVTLTKNYTPFYTGDVNATIKVLNAAENGTENFTKNVPAAKNIIKQMNEASSLTGKKAVELLRAYIDEIYGNKFTKRSELFVGGKAVYDVDELVALFRCVKGNATFLTGKTGVNVVPLFPRARTNDRTYDLYRFLQFFGVRGVESRKEWMYVNDQGKLVDARSTQSFLDGVKKLREMYQDGLIMQNFTTAKINDKDDYRGPFLTDADTSTTYGFATYDYNQTTTAYNDTNKNANFKYISLLPAIADFDMDGSKDTFEHYTESWRSVKPQGWFITAKTTGAQLERALELVDYLYSPEGNRIMSYGPDEYLAKNADGSIKTMDYQGKQVPVLSDDCKEELKTLAKGNYTNYYRYYLGGTLPVGYIKEQGMEYQTVAVKAQDSLNMINHAIQYGVLNHVNHKGNNTNHKNDIVPVTLPFTAGENTALSSNFTALNDAFSSEKNKVMAVSKVIENGFGTHDNLDLSEANFLSTINTTLNLTGFVKLYNDAYGRFLRL